MHNSIAKRRRLFLLQASAVILAMLALFVVLSSASLARPAPAALLADLKGFTNAGASDTTQLSVYATNGDAQVPTAAFNALNSKAGGTLTVSWDQQTGVPRFLSGNSHTARIPYTPTSAEQGNPVAIARGFLDENRTLFKLDAVSRDFGTPKIEPDPLLGFSNIRLPQMFNNIPVFGKQMVVHLDKDGQIVAVNGQYTPGINVPTQPVVSKEDAQQTAVEDILNNKLSAAERATVKTNVLADKTALTVYVDSTGRATLTWQIKVEATAPLGEWTVFVNARRPVVVHSIDSAENAKSRLTYTSRNTTNLPGRLLIQEGERSSDPVAQAAHDAAGKVYDYYMGTFKRDSIDGQGSDIVSSVHYGNTESDAENAAWVSEANQMVYGDGGQIFKPLAYGLDVVGHELTHGVTDSTAQLVYEGQSGALNEAYSDIFGALIDRTNWTIGETVVKSPPFPIPYLRSLSDPEVGGRYDRNDPLSGVGQPGSMSDYANLPLSRNEDNGGVHINSGVPSHAAYFLAQAITKEKMEQIYYRTLTQYLTPESDFYDSGRATVQAATDLYGQTEVNAVRAAFAQVGINLSTDTSPAPPASGGAGSSGAPTPGPTTQPPTPNLPAGCREAIVNGSFEGTNGWKEVSSSQVEIIDPQLPHTGSQSAWLGGTDKETLQYIDQDVALPANATSVSLSYYRLLHEEVTGLSGLFAKDATFTVLIANTSGNELAHVEQLASSTADDAWHQAKFDLTRYAGQTIRLVFTASNPRGNVSSFFVDDVSLVVCTTGQAPQAPPATGNTVYVKGTISDADTGRGVNGAQIFFLKPGTTATSAAADGSLSSSEVTTYGTADSQGHYQATNALTKGQTYSVIIMASGFRPALVDNGLTLPANAPNPTTVNGTLRSSR